MKLPGVTLSVRLLLYTRMTPPGRPTLPEMVVPEPAPVPITDCLLPNRVHKLLLHEFSMYSAEPTLFSTTVSVHSNILCRVHSHQHAFSPIRVHFKQAGMLKCIISCNLCTLSKQKSSHLIFWSTNSVDVCCLKMMSSSKNHINVHLYLLEMLFWWHKTHLLWIKMVIGELNFIYW